jgi:hypothetical protein
MDSPLPLYLALVALACALFGLGIGVGWRLGRAAGREDARDRQLSGAAIDRLEGTDWSTLPMLDETDA